MKYAILLFALASFSASAKQTITITGSVVDGSGNPVTKCDVFFNQQKWISKDSVHAKCDAKGNYRAEIEPGLYNSIYICDEDKYAKTALEFWGWNLNLTESQVIDAAFDTIEVYSLNTWASNGGSNSMFASFRPMLLQNASAEQKMQLADNNFRYVQSQGKRLAVLDLTPNLNLELIKAWVDGQAIELLDYFWSYEKIDNCSSFPKGYDVSAGCYMPMIIAQFRKPKLRSGQHRLTVRITDQDSGQIGEGITDFSSNDSGYGF